MGSYILVLFFMLPNGNIHVAHSGKPNADRMDIETCQGMSKELVAQAKNKVLWVKSMCVPVPDAPSENDRPSTPTPSPKGVDTKPRLVV